MSTIHPVSVSRHAGKRWQRYPNYVFAAGDAVCPLAALELSKAAMSMPLAFMMSGDELLPVAVQGLQSGENLFVAADGRWLGSYIPAAYRGYPFVLAGGEGGQQVLCVDEGSGLLHDDLGEPFFSEDTRPSAVLAEVLNFLTQVATSREATRRICALLQKFGVVQVWPLKLQTAEGERSVEGLWRIDEAALAVLSDEDFLVLRSAGALPLIYSQLLSMQHIAHLGQLARSRAEAVRQAARPVEGILDLEFLNRGETISFGNL